MAKKKRVHPHEADEMSTPALATRLRSKILQAAVWIYFFRLEYILPSRLKVIGIAAHSTDESMALQPWLYKEAAL